MGNKFANYKSWLKFGLQIANSFHMILNTRKQCTNKLSILQLYIQMDMTTSPYFKSLTSSVTIWETAACNKAQGKENNWCNCNEWHFSEFYQICPCRSEWSWTWKIGPDSPCWTVELMFTVELSFLLFRWICRYYHYVVNSVNWKLS